VQIVNTTLSAVVSLATWCVFAQRVDQISNWVDGAYEHYAKTIQTALDGYADCVLAADPTAEEFDTFAGILEARATTDPPINNEQFWRALDDIEDRYNE